MVGTLMLYSYIPLPRGYGLDTGDKFGVKCSGRQQRGTGQFLKEE
jgi:hypothetical protein